MRGFETLLEHSQTQNRVDRKNETFLKGNSSFFILLKEKIIRKILFSVKLGLKDKKIKIKRT